MAVLQFSRNFNEMLSFYGGIVKREFSQKYQLMVLVDEMQKPNGLIVFRNI